MWEMDDTDDKISSTNLRTKKRKKTQDFIHSPSTTTTLNDVGVDMTQMALDGKLDMVFGREKEIRSALRTLGRRRKNNPCLIGDPGVGKVRLMEIKGVRTFI